MKRLLYAFILLFGMFSVHGQSVWTGAVDSDWTNPANWSAGVPTAGSVATIPANPVSPVFGGTPIINYTIQLAGMLTFDDFVFNAGNIIVFESGSIVNNAQFINGNGRVLDVDGHFENNGTLDNFGMVDIAASGSLDNEAGATFNNNNETLAFGPVLNAGTTNNNGEMNIIVSLDNSGTFNNYGTFESQAGSTTENRANAIMEVFAGSSYSVNGIYNNLGSTRSRGDFIVQIASVFTNDDFFLNRSNGNMEVAGRVINNNVFTINGPLMINSSGIVENNNQINNNAGINLDICGNLIQLNTGAITGSIQNNGNVYEINGTINETNLEFGVTFTDINDRPAPLAACKNDAFLQLPESGTITFTAADIEKGRSYGNCGAQLISREVSPTSFTSADVGVQIVTVTVTDEFGNSTSCDDFVTVLPYTPPIVPVDDPDITFECPEDITATPEPGAQFASASFVTPEATTTCSPVMSINATLCPDVDEHISGFDFIGQVGGSKYFISHDAEDWFTANDIAQANGGQLVTIDDAAENAYITNNINPSSGSIWTGFRSLNNTPDNFTWESGAPVNYTNWSNGEPNNSDGDPTVAARLVRNTGMWTDRSTDVHYEFVIEIACYDVEIAGYDYLGSNDGSLYYESHATENWTNAANAATAIGGNLATINNAAENTFVQNAVNPSTGSVWIGLTNNNNGNNFSWQSGEAVSYTNWNPGEPNETQNNVAARLVKSSGFWTDRNVDNNYFEFVVELPVPTMGPSCPPTGSITREVWTNISGVNISQIPVNTTPDLTEQIALFETPTNFANNYGTRVRGYIHPTVSGDYRFWIATDDRGELWLSSDDDPANKTRIAYVTGWTSSRQWNKFPEQRSALIYLEAGQRYYIEALQKEGSGGDNLAVRWSLPDGTIEAPIPGSVLSSIDDCVMDNELTVTQIAGPQSGGNFPVGETPIVFEVTDACGNLEICEFNVTVEDNPADFEIVDCPSDITINTLPGASTAVATFDEPSGTSTCFRGGPVSVVQNLGLESGEAFPIGSTQITYAVFDSCGNFEGCNFFVNVVEVPATIVSICPLDVVLQATSSNSTVTANWPEPTVSTNCFADGLTVEQVSGPANGSDLGVGTYPVIYVFTDACNNTEICTFNVVVNSCPDMDGDGICAVDDCDDNDASLPAAPGTACDDGDVNTENDVIGADGCSCAGTIIPCSLEGGDADGDGICADVDCDDNDASLPAAPGTACDDGDAGTENDVIGADGCSCAGTVIVPCANEGGDADGDGICADVDCDDNDASLPAAPGTACDDGDAGTENDVIGADGCSCAGTVIVPCANEGGDADGDGICADVDCDDNDASLPATPGTACDDGDAETENDVIGADGCSCAGTVIVPCANEGGDADGDGICADVDCDDNDASLPATPGTACDDGDAGTENDVIGADGCSCAGTPINNNPDCDDIVITPGVGNITVSGLNAPVTSVQVFNSSWNEVFKCFADCDTPEQVVDGLPEGTYFVKAGLFTAAYQRICDVEDYYTVLGGDPCAANGGDADGDGICADDDCDDNDASLPATPGTSCDDGDAGTENDVIGADGCSCAGTPILVGCANAGGDADGDGICADDDCDDNDASLPATPGTSCDDGDAGTENDVIGADGCSCAGTPIVVGCANAGGDADGDGICADDDCDDNDASLPAAPGTACDDGDAATENDVIGADGCSCAGTPIVTGCNPTYVLSPGNITVNGLNGAVNSVKLLDISNGWNDVVNCFGNCPTPASFDLPAGPYFLQVTVRDAYYNIICELNETIMIPDGCTTGATCDDGDDCTTDDVFDENCICVGTPVADNDGDGFCAVEDCDDNDASLPATPGSSCDDGNPDTTGDVYQADGCTCAGVVVGACNPMVTPADSSLVITGLSGPFNVIQVFNTANWSTLINCWGDCHNQVVDADPGNYFVRLRVLDDSYQEVCRLETNVVVSGGGTYSIAPDTEFLHLFAREENRAVGLNWVNNSEYRNDYFVVERSIDGINFTELKTVDAYGYESQEVTNYEDEDLQPALGEGYYRVRQVFEDGTFRYSNIEKVNFDIDLTAIGVFPNPAETEVQLSLVDFAGRSAEVQIYSPLGVLMDAVSLDEIPDRAIRFNVANYQAGLYTITVKVDQRKRFSKRFVKIGL